MVIDAGCGDADETESPPTDSERHGHDAGDTAEKTSDSIAPEETDDDTDELDTSGGFTCSPEMNDLARIEKPNPLISLDVQTAASEEVEDAEKLVDGLYHSGGGAAFGVPTTDAPAWVSLEIGPGFTRLLVFYADTGWTDYDDVSGGAPLSYSLQYSSDSTDGEDGTWGDAVTVTDNPVRTRAHSIDVTEDTTWIRMVITAAQDDSDVTLDELAVYDISESGDDIPQDTWFFMGDSITKMAFERASGYHPFDTVIPELVEGFRPAMVSGGIGGETTRDAVNHIEEWLSLNPDFKHIGIGYGTNDAWGNKRVASTDFEDNLRTLIETILADDRVPHLSSIPYAKASTHTTLPEFNAVIESLIEEYELPCGPDMYTWFRLNSDHLDDSDGIHPTSNGRTDINRVWAESAAPLYFKEE